MTRYLLPGAIATELVRTEKMVLLKSSGVQPLDLGAAARYIRFVFLTAYLTADAPDRPMWNAGEFFGTLGAQ